MPSTNRKLRFTKQALREYQGWAKSGNRRILDRIDALLEETLGTPFEGLGKPEPLSGQLAGLWSRRITQQDRLVYRVDDSELTVLQCRGHYDDH